MVEGVHKMGEEAIREVVEVQEIVIEVEVSLNQARIWRMLMMGLNVMTFKSRMRQRRLMR